MKKQEFIEKLVVESVALRLTEGTFIDAYENKRAYWAWYKWVRQYAMRENKNPANVLKVREAVNMFLNCTDSHAKASWKSDTKKYAFHCPTCGLRATLKKEKQ